MSNNIKKSTAIKRTHFLLLLTIFIVSQTLQGQTQNPLLEKEQFKYSEELEKLIPHQKEIYKVDAQQRMIQYDSYSWQEASNVYEKTHRADQTYTENGLLFTKVILNIDDPITTNRSWEYNYYEGGCTDSLVFIRHYPNGKPSEKWLTHYNIGQCERVDLLQQYIWIEEEQQWRKILSWEYQYDIDMIGITISRTIEGTSSEVGLIIHTLDSEGNTVKSWTNYVDYAAEIETNYEYNDKNDIIYTSFKIKPYPSDNDLDLVSEEFQNYIYNDKNQKSRIETTHQDYYNSTLTHEYDVLEEYIYHCDGLLKEIVEYKEGILVKKEKYVYKEGVDCGSISDDIKIYPNPVQSYLKIESTLLEYPNSKVKLYNMNGQLINTYEIQERRDHYEIPMLDFSKGMYLIQVEGGENVEIQKILKN